MFLTDLVLIHENLLRSMLTFQKKFNKNTQNFFRTSSTRIHFRTCGTQIYFRTRATQFFFGFANSRHSERLAC